MKRYVLKVWAARTDEPHGMVDDGDTGIHLYGVYVRKGRKSEWGFDDDWPPRRVIVTVEWPDEATDV